MEYIQQLRDRINDCKHGQSGQLVDEAVSLLGLSRQTIYRKLRQVGYKTSRKLRADRRDSVVSIKSLELVSALLVESTRQTGKRLMSMRRAAEIARHNGAEDLNVADATLHRLLRMNGLHPEQLKQPSPHTKIRSLHPNYMWQFDVSVCVLFYLDGGGVGVMDKDVFYKNKPENFQKISKKRVLRYLVTDHASGAFFVRYYQAAGEDQATLFTFLMEAFHERPDQLLHGVPSHLLWDAGSANQAAAIRNLLDALDVNHAPHIPGNPRAKGQVERTHDLIERDFEGALYLLKVRDIDHLNALADTWQHHNNATLIHSRHGSTRYGMWQTIRAEQLRLCPPVELCRDLMFSKPERRVVKGDLTIQFAVKGYDSAFYSVANVPHIRVGDAVEVVVNAYRAPAIYVLDQDENGETIRFECTPVAKDQFGFPLLAPIYGQEYKAPADTDNDIIRKAQGKAAYGADTELEVKRARKNREPAFGGDVDAYTYLEDAHKPDFIRRPGTELHVPNPVQIDDKPLTHMEVMKILRERLGRAVRADENSQIRSWYPQGVPDEELDDLVARLDGSDGTGAKLSVV